MSFPTLPICIAIALNITLSGGQVTGLDLEGDMPLASPLHGQGNSYTFGLVLHFRFRGDIAFH